MFQIVGFGCWSCCEVCIYYAVKFLHFTYTTWELQLPVDLQLLWVYRTRKWILISLEVGCPVGALMDSEWLTNRPCLLCWVHCVWKPTYCIMVSRRSFVGILTFSIAADWWQWRRYNELVKFMIVYVSVANSSEIHNVHGNWMVCVGLAISWRIAGAWACLNCRVYMFYYLSGTKKIGD